ncbi:hypothetical protein [Rubinisphaera margarita]|uniref:hypothetical protein n=1 Tax=Rubinisphaera margarita TaxID=2909586 RepID=UPI001EE821A6|nr:hypothetical protein [Rubinisphaera margarita]MCG6155609.1 hypothetical protein [Rubinisphaera margarita]
MIDRTVSGVRIFAAMVVTLSAVQIASAQSATAVEAGANVEPNYLPRAFHAQPGGAWRANSITADYYITEMAEDWGYRRDYDYDRLSYDEASSVYSVYDTYYNNYRVKVPDAGVIPADPANRVRGTAIVTPGQVVDEEPVIGPKSPIAPPADVVTRPGVAPPAAVVPPAAVAPRVAAYPPVPTYGYDEATDDDNWFYDYYETPAYRPVMELPEYYREFDFVNDVEGDGPFDGVSQPLDRLKDNKPPVRKPTEERTDVVQSETVVQEAQTARSVQGTVMLVKNVPMRGQQISHRVIQVQNAQGDNFVVDLGNLDDLAETAINTGDRISVNGVMTTVGDKEVILAREVRLGENQVVIDRNFEIVQGTVKSTRIVDYGGEPIQIVTLQTPNGEMIVDLGIALISEKIVLKEGNALTVAGSPIQAGEQTVLMAESVRQQETNVKVNRPRTDNAQDLRQTNGGQAAEQPANQEMNEKKPQSKLAAASTIDEDGRKKTVKMPVKPEARPDAPPTPGESATQAGTDQQPERSKRAPLVTVEGAVQSVKDQDFGKSTRRLVTVKTTGGNQVRLDLGPTQQVQISLEQGDRISAFGLATQLDTEQPLVLVNRINQGEQSFVANRYTGNDEPVTISGEVVASKTSPVMGESHGIITINTAENNQKVMVDLGPVDADDFSVPVGTALTVDGILLDLKAGKMLVANSVRPAE